MPGNKNKWLRRSALESMIAYEKHKGTHTYHQCKCDRNATRSGKCWQCLEEELERINNAR